MYKNVAKHYHVDMTDAVAKASTFPTGATFGGGIVGALLLLHSCTLSALKLVHGRFVTHHYIVLPYKQHSRSKYAPVHRTFCVTVCLLPIVDI